MSPVFTAICLILIDLFVVCLAEDCHPGSVRECLARFDQIIESCGKDVDCQCDALWTSGVHCFGTCPDDAKAHFIRNFRNNECSDQAWKSLAESTRIPASPQEDPTSTPGISSHSETGSIRSEIEPVSTSETEVVSQLPGAKLRRWLNLLSLNKTRVSETHLGPSSSFGSKSLSRSAVTAMQQPTTSLSLEEEHRRKQLQRMKENLRSIRSSRALESSLARLAAEALTSDMPPTDTPAPPEETTSAPEHHEESSASSYVEAHLVAVAVVLFCLYVGLPAL